MFVNSKKIDAKNLELSYKKFAKADANLSIYTPKQIKNLNGFANLRVKELGYDFKDPLYLDKSFKSYVEFNTTDLNIENDKFMLKYKDLNISVDSSKIDLDTTKMVAKFNKTYIDIGKFLWC